MDNYLFDFKTDVINDVSFVIIPRKITVAPETSSSFYYGEGEYEAQNMYKVTSVTGFVTKEGLEVTTEIYSQDKTNDLVEDGVAYHADTYVEEIVSYIPKEGTKLSNYEITLETSTFIILPRPLHINTNSVALSYNAEIYEYPKTAEAVVFEYGFNQNLNNLVGDDSFYISKIRYDYYDEDTHEYLSTYTPLKIAIYTKYIEEVVFTKGRESDYSISYYTSPLDIGLPFVTVKLEDYFEEIYDGSVYTITNRWSYAPYYGVDTKIYTLPSGFTLEFDNVFVDQYGNKSKSISEPGYYSISYEDSYKIYDRDGNVVNEDFSLRVSFNYAYIFVRTIHIKPVSVSKTYDGEDLVTPTDQFEYVDFTNTPLHYVDDKVYWTDTETNADLLPGHHIRIETSEEPFSKAKSTTTQIVYYEIYDDYGNIIQSSDTQNVYYRIVYNADQLYIPKEVKASYRNKIKNLYKAEMIIEKRHISITAEDIEMQYGDFESPEYTINTVYGKDVGLLPTHTVEAYITNIDSKEPGEKEVSVSYRIFDEDGNKVQSNYKIENTRKIVLNIKPRLIVITVGSAVVKYDPNNPDFEFTHSEFEIREEDRLFLEERELLIDCNISGFISRPGIAINTIKYPDQDILIYDVISEKLGKIKDYTDCFDFEIHDGQLVMYE